MISGLPLRVLLVGAAMTVELAAAPKAQADLLLVFNRVSVQPGQVVGAFSGDNRGRPERWPRVHGIRLYLVPMGHAHSPRHQIPTGPPADPTWIPLGRLRQDPSGVARIRFAVPDVAPGDYTIGYWCMPCAPPQGATFTQAYPGTHPTGRRFGKILIVEPNQASVPAGGGKQGLNAAAVVGAALVCAAACAVWSRRRRRHVRATSCGP
jgi:hypothetical protein